MDEGNISTIIIQGADSTTVRNKIDFTWKEKNIEAGFRIPLITTSSRYASSVTIGNALGVTTVSDFESSFRYKDVRLTERFIPQTIRNDTVLRYYPFYDYIGNGTLVYNHLTLSASRLLKQSRRDIRTRFASPRGRCLRG